MKTHKLARQISPSRDCKADAQEQLNLLTQHMPDSGAQQGSFYVENGKDFKARLDGPLTKQVQWEVLLQPSPKGKGNTVSW